MTDTDLTVTLDPSTWMQVGYAIDQRISALYQERITFRSPLARDEIDAAIRPLEQARRELDEALYPEPEPEDGLDAVKRERDLTIERIVDGVGSFDREGLPEFNGSFR